MGRGSGVRVRGNAIQISFNWQRRRFQITLKMEPTKGNLKYAERLRSTILLEIAQGTFSPEKYFDLGGAKKALPTVASLLDAWLSSVRRTLSPSTLRGYESAIKVHLLPAFGPLPIDELSTQTIRTWVGTLTGISNKRINNVLIPLRAVCADAFQDGLIDRDPTERIRNLPLASRDPDPFSLGEMTRILDACDGPLRNLLQFAFWSGLRTSEYIGLEWGDVDFERGIVSVRRAVLLGKTKEPKTASGRRDVVLLDAARSALLAQKEHTYMRGQNGQVFCHPVTGRPFWSDGEVYRMWEGVLKKAGVPFRNPYQTRHTYASLLLSAGENPMWVAAQMGHRDWGMIRKRYGRWLPSTDPDVGRKANLLAGKITADGDKMVTEKNG